MKGYAIALAWPETKCKQSGAWYDTLLYYLGINTDGYYKVGHSAVVLIDAVSEKCFYYDFGRYHAPTTFGRVRSQRTDFELAINTLAIISDGELINQEEILQELLNNPATHGTGYICGASTPIDFNQATQYVSNLQAKEIIPYGPFIPSGTNCSRFTRSAIVAGKVSFSEKLFMYLAPTITPKPMWLLRVLKGKTNVQSTNEENWSVKPILVNTL